MRYISVSSFVIQPGVTKYLDNTKLSGYFSPSHFSEAPWELGSKNIFEKITIEYRNYLFTLVNVTLTESLTEELTSDFGLGKVYKFHAEDIVLERSTFAGIIA